jgi:hypothetical protein
VLPQKIPINRQDDGELLGFIAQEGGSWSAQTIFGYTIARTTSRAQAEQVVREQGLNSLMGVWQYFDKDDQRWYPCVIKEAYENRVVVIRTNAMGYQDVDNKRISITDPSETNLIKA